MDKELKAVLQLRHDTKANLQQANMVLRQGEPCIEMDGDVFKLKVGDGTTTYNNLPYYMVTSETAAIDRITCVDGVITIESEGKSYSFDSIAKDANGYQIDATYLKIVDVDKALSTVSANPVQNNVVTAALAVKANVNSPAFTGSPTAPTAAVSVSNDQIATTGFVHALVNSKIAAADAMIYKGTIGTGGTITALPATHLTGWTYKVATAGTYAGMKCEVGDMVVCLRDGTVAANGDWTVIQANIDGAVIGPVSSVTNRVAVFDGITGKVIKDSGYTIAASVPANAKFTDTTYAVFTGATAGSAGTTGLVPVPAAGKQDSFLRGDGTYQKLAKAVEVGIVLPTSFKGQMFIKKLEV